MLLMLYLSTKLTRKQSSRLACNMSLTEVQSSKLGFELDSVSNCMCVVGICSVDDYIVGNCNRSLTICEEMEEEVKENHTITPVYSEEEFADLLGSAEWTPVSNHQNLHEAGSTASNARGGLSDLFSSLISTL